MYGANFSIGVNLFYRIVKQASELLARLCSSGQQAREGMAGGGAAGGQGQPGAGLAHAVGEGKRVAVDGSLSNAGTSRGLVKRREMAAGGTVSRPVDAHYRADAGLEQRMSRGDADPVAAIGEAILGKPSHVDAGISRRCKMKRAMPLTSSRFSWGSARSGNDLSVARATMLGSSLANKGVPRSLR